MFCRDDKRDHQPQRLDLLLLIFLTQSQVLLRLEDPIRCETALDRRRSANVDPDSAGKGAGGRELQRSPISVRKRVREERRTIFANVFLPSSHLAYALPFLNTSNSPTTTDSIGVTLFVKPNERPYTRSATETTVAQMVKQLMAFQVRLRVEPRMRQQSTHQPTREVRMRCLQGGKNGRQQG